MKFNERMSTFNALTTEGGIYGALHQLSTGRNPDLLRLSVKIATSLRTRSELAVCWHLLVVAGLGSSGRVSITSGTERVVGRLLT